MRAKNGIISFLGFIFTICCILTISGCTYKPTPTEEALQKIRLAELENIEAAVRACTKTGGSAKVSNWDSRLVACEYLVRNTIISSRKDNEIHKR